MHPGPRMRHKQLILNRVLGKGRYNHKQELIIWLKQLTRWVSVKPGLWTGLWTEIWTGFWTDMQFNDDHFQHSVALNGLDYALATAYPVCSKTRLLFMLF